MHGIAINRVVIDIEKHELIAFDIEQLVNALGGDRQAISAMTRVLHSGFAKEERPIAFLERAMPEVSQQNSGAWHTCRDRTAMPPSACAREASPCTLV